MVRVLQTKMLLIIMLSTFYLYGQEKCRVLMPSISDSYTGKCKNGLAHGKGEASGTDKYAGNFSKGLPEGKGIYTWANGSSYNGEWVAGKRHGIGTYSNNSDSGDSIQMGLWQNDEYRGAVPPPPNVTYNSGVDRYNIKKQNTGLTRVLVDIYQNGGRNKSVTGLSIVSSSGNDLVISQSVGFDNVVFPVTVKIMYSTLNKLNQAPYTVYFNLTIYEPGDWTIELNN